MVFRALVGAAGRAAIDAMPEFGNVMRQLAPVYLTHVAPVMAYFLAEQHKITEQSLTHIKDEGTRALVAAILLSGVRAGLSMGD